MKFGVIDIPLVPVRSQPSDHSELVTQLLFGELYNVSAEKGNWCQVISEHDQYTGWIDKKQCCIISEEYHRELTSLKPLILSDLISQAVRQSDNTILHLPAGSAVYKLSKKKIFLLNEEKYVLHEEPVKHDPENIRDQLISCARKYINVPYLWGGKSPFGIDCSGLVQVVYKMNGIALPRDARLQVSRGRTLNFIAEVKPGDLAFFDNNDGNIVHTGIVIDANHIIHASGIVRIDILDHQGIFNTTAKRYTHKLRVLQNVID